MHNDRIAAATFFTDKPGGLNEKLLLGWKCEKAISEIVGNGHEPQTMIQRCMKRKAHSKSWEYHAIAQ